jgi:O-antigen ligase
MVKKIIEGKYILYIIASIIPFLTISIFIADLIYSLVAIIFLIYIIRNNFIFDYKNTFFLTSISFYVVCVISSSLSDDILFSLKSSLPLLRVLLFIFLLSYLISFNKDLINIFYNFLLITFCLLVLYGFYEYIVKYSKLIESGSLSYTNIRLKLFFSDEEKLGSFLVRLYGLFLALHIIKKKKSNFQNIFFIILSSLCSIIILLSGERTSLFFMIMFFFTCLVLLNIKFRIKLICISLISISFFILLFLNSNLSNRMLFDKNNEISFSKDEIIIFTPQHTAHYKTAAKMFLDKPYFGHGPKMFRILCSNERYYSKSKNNKSGCSSHPHNTYLQLLAETGLVGMSIFSLGFIYIIYTLIKHFFMKIFYRKISLTDYQIILSLTVIITFWPFSPAGNIFNNWLLIVYSIPISFYVNEFFECKKVSKS